MKVYLAGPITGCDISEAMAWREKTKDLLSSHGVRCLVPLSFSEIKNMASGVFQESLGGRNKHIFEKDLFMVAGCDVVLVNFKDWKAVSKGTLFEVGYAYALRKPIVAVGDAKDAAHPFIGESCIFFPSVEDAAGYILEMCGLEQA